MKCPPEKLSPAFLNNNFKNKTPEEMSAIGQKGGKSGGPAAWAKKTFRSLAMTVLEGEPSEKLKENFKKQYPDFDKLLESGVNIKLMMLLAQIQKSLYGDSNAFCIVERILGEDALEVGDKLEKLLNALNTKANEKLDIPEEQEETETVEIGETDKTNE